MEKNLVEQHFPTGLIDESDYKKFAKHFKCKFVSLSEGYKDIIKGKVLVLAMGDGFNDMMEMKARVLNEYLSMPDNTPSIVFELNGGK